MAPVRTDIKFTYAEYRALPETSRYQLVEGDLLISPGPSFRHQKLVARLFNALYNFAERRKRGDVLSAPIDVILSEENVFQPDIVFISPGRRSIIAPEGLRGAPDLCVEVLSARSEEIDRTVKRLLYAKYGVEEYWIVDPEKNRVEIYRLQENASAPVRELGVTGVLTSSLFPDFSANLGEIYSA